MYLCFAISVTCGKYAGMYKKAYKEQPRQYTYN